MSIVDTTIPALPTSRQFDPRDPMATAAPGVEVQHQAARRGISMADAIAQGERIAREQAAVEDPDFQKAAAWLRGKSSQRILIELVMRITKLESEVKDNG